MRTRILSIHDISEAGRLIRDGGLVVFPTETVYGLGGNAYSPDSAEKIFAAKGRPSDNPLIVHVSSLSRTESVAASIDEVSRALGEDFWPGPLTLILPRHPSISPSVTGGLDTVGVRVPGDTFAREFLEAAEVPVAAPSANRSGRPSPTAFWMALADLDGRVDAIIRGPDTRIGLESTIVWVNARSVHVLRPGMIGKADIRRSLDSRGWDSISIIDESAAEQPKSPGTRYRHYSPKAKVSVYTDPRDLAGFASRIGAGVSAAVIGIHRREDIPEATAWSVTTYGGVEEYAKNLYRDLVLSDREGKDEIFLYLPPDGASDGSVSDGLVSALRDRILRAAGRGSDET